jgi:hypothetical protein
MHAFVLNEDTHGTPSFFCLNKAPLYFNKFQTWQFLTTALFRSMIRGGRICTEPPPNTVALLFFSVKNCPKID